MFMRAFRFEPSEGEGRCDPVAGKLMRADVSTMSQ
jgi:hypothetical protein